MPIRLWNTLFHYWLKNPFFCPWLVFRCLTPGPVRLFPPRSAAGFKDSGKVAVFVKIVSIVVRGTPTAAGFADSGKVAVSRKTS
jgi:hypothetical protein